MFKDLIEVFEGVGIPKPKPVCNKKGRTVYSSECPIGSSLALVDWLCVNGAPPAVTIAKWNDTVVLVSTGRAKTIFHFKIYCRSADHAATVVQDLASGIQR